MYLLSTPTARIRMRIGIWGKADKSENWMSVFFKQTHKKAHAIQWHAFRKYFVCVLEIQETTF